MMEHRRRTTKISFKSWSQTFQKSAVLFSLGTVLLLATLCSAGTIQQRPSSGVIGTGSLASTRKTPSRPVMHPAFANAGRGKGVEIWRIENFAPVAYPKRDYGKFFTGDSYIILNTKENKNKDLSWDVHFWLGSETSADEAGAAAILTVQLDDSLNGLPVQHREVQDHESQLFLSYFPNGVRYEIGGVASGFRHTDINDPGEKRLFQVKGKRNVRVRQVNLSVSSMNKGDCFILDAGNNIYVYVGSGAKRVERLKSISAANQIRDQDHNGRAKVEIIDEFSTESDKENFFTTLGSGSPSTVPDESVAEEDSAFETNDESLVTLYKVSDAAGSLKIDTIAQKPLRQDMLVTNDCFILDTGSGIYVWVGRGATQQEKSQAIVKAQEFLTTKKYPAWTQVHRIVESAESAPFKQYFSTWRDAGMAHTRLIRAANDDDSDTAEDEEFDPSVLHTLKKSGGRALGFMPDNGEGEIEAVWRIDNFALVPVEPEMYGMFYGGDSYVVQYHYKNKRGGQGYVIYYWQGTKSTIDEKAAAAIHASKLDEKLGGGAIQVRAVQGHEPRHFLKIFQGKIINFMGGNASGFRHINDEQTYDDNGRRLFVIRGTSNEDVRAIQRPTETSSLASDDAFVLDTSDTIYIWKGKGASDFEKDMALNVASRIMAGDKKQVEINEGEETDGFWSSLDGNKDYDREIGPTGPPFLEARLFHCQILSYRGKFKCEEVNNFEQDDLNVDDIMMLDGGDEVYLWIGEGASIEEKEKSFDLARHYIRTDPTGRTEHTVPIIKIQQRHEPRSFKRLFPSWNDDQWESLPTYADIKKKVAEANSLLEQ